MKYLTNIGISTVLAAGIGFAAASAFAAQQTLGSFQDWTAFSDGSERRICYMGSVPKKKEGSYTVRGDTYVLATHRPGEKVFGEISVEAGYTYKPGSEVEVNIDGQAFKLFTQGGNAWAYDEKADRALIEAMKAGRQMVVKGTSSRGTLTTDTYSLSGFSAAMQTIDKACGRT
jgi:Invasion associated locus B (IalB) protein